jgi:hypothetical protein
MLTLVVPDLHQDLAWMERVLAAETAWDRIVFLGDYLDTRFPRQVASLEETVDWLEDFASEHGDRVTRLLGNHDLPYLEVLQQLGAGAADPVTIRFPAGVEILPRHVQAVAAGWRSPFRRGFRLLAEVEGWLLSHAGIHPSFWPGGSDPRASLARLETEAHRALTDLPTTESPLLEAGAARGGFQPVGGLTWLDWDEEFEDGLPLPQLVGHTRHYGQALQTGRSWCLDGGQTTYGLLRDGALTIGRA